MENRYKKLIKNTAVFFVGTFGSKILSFLIVPLYTYVLTPNEYGKIDLFTTAIRMMVPFTTLMFADAILRFIASGEIKRNIVVSDGIVVFLYGAILSIICIPLYKTLFNLGENVFLYVLALILNTYTSIFPHYLRAVGKNVSFAVNGMIQTCAILGFNVLFLIVFRLGMKGYLYALVLSQLASAVHVTISGKILDEFSFRNINLRNLKEMLRFSIPIIPNSLMWWIMSAGDKYVINYFMGDAANGLYSISLKIPTIISMVYSVFTQAWQLSAIEEMKKKDEGEFYKKIFGVLSIGLCVGVGVIIPIVRPIFCTILSKSYHSTWKYVPFLCIAAICDCFESFASVTYSITKKSGKAVIATLIGFMVNITVNCLLINIVGLYGVAIGTIVGNIIVMKIRFSDMRDDMGIALDIRKLNAALILLIMEAFVLVGLEQCMGYIFAMAIVVLITLIHRNEVKGILFFAKRVMKRKNCNLE